MEKMYKTQNLVFEKINKFAKPLTKLTKLKKKKKDTNYQYQE